MSKKIIAACLSLIFMMISFGVNIDFDAKAAAALPNKPGFLWGINGHNRNYGVYPEKFLEEQVKAAAVLGSKIYRFNYNAQSGADFRYLDKVVAMVDAYGMELMLVMDSRGGTLDDIETRFNLAASRYNGKNNKGKINYIQIFNEVDIAALELKYNGVGTPDGSSVNHYNASDLDNIMAQFNAALTGIKKAESDVKTVINISYLHYGMITYFQSKGLKWDIIGLDWYSNMGNFTKILEPIMSGFTHDIMICETNLWSESTTNHNNVADWKWLTDSMTQLYTMGNSRIKGMIFYELLDEMNFETDKYEREAHFGLIFCDNKGNIGKVKPIYTTIQGMIGGGPVTKREVNYGGTSSVTNASSAAPSKAASSKPATSKATSSTAAVVSENTESEEESTGELVSEDDYIDENSKASGESSAKKAGTTSSTVKKKPTASILWFIIPCVIAVLGGAGTVTFLMLKKRKAQELEPDSEDDEA